MTDIHVVNLVWSLVIPWASREWHLKASVVFPSYWFACSPTPCSLTIEALPLRSLQKLRSCNWTIWTATEPCLSPGISRLKLWGGQLHAGSWRYASQMPFLRQSLSLLTFLNPDWHPGRSPPSSLFRSGATSLRMVGARASEKLQELEATETRLWTLSWSRCSMRISCVHICVASFWGYSMSWRDGVCGVTWC